MSILGSILCFDICTCILVFMWVLLLVVIDTEGLMPKKMEELAYQATDKVYGKDDTGPYECLR